MKKLLLLAALAASFSSASADEFSDIFALKWEDKPIADGQTITVKNYYDEFLMDQPDFANQPGYVSEFKSKTVISATNISDEPWTLRFTLTRESPSLDEFPLQDSAIGTFQLCYGYGNVAGNCMGLQDNKISGETNKAVEEEETVNFDIEQLNFTDAKTSLSLKLVLDIVEGGEVIDGGSRTINVVFSHENDITLGVGNIVADTESTYYTLQGVRVAQPRKGNIYIVRTANGVTKRLF